MESGNGVPNEEDREEELPVGRHEGTSEEAEDDMIEEGRACGKGEMVKDVADTEEKPPTLTTSSKTSSEASSQTNEIEVEHAARGSSLELPSSGSRVEEEELPHPGAIAIAGPGAHPSDSIGFDDTVPEGPAAPVAEVSAYVVDDEGITEEQIQNIRRQSMTQFLAEAVEAEDVKPELGWRDWRRWALIALVAAVFAGIAVGITVPLTRRGNGIQEAGNTQALENFDESVLASIYFRESTGGHFVGAMIADVRSTGLFENSTISSGFYTQVQCTPRPCMENPGACKNGGREYEPGCCLGSDCDEEVRCGEACPSPPESCFLTDPNDKNCNRKDCYTCNQVNGEDIWLLHDFVQEIDCVAYGTSMHPENGQKYKWTIVCGAVIEGAIEELNFGLGEYACSAYRIGAGFTDDEGGLLSVLFPCQYISLAECGCAPEDVYTFGLPEPVGPCLPGGDCPFLCSDAGKEHARKLCHAFPGDIKWWEGDNVFNDYMFLLDGVGDEYELEIYIKGE